MGNQKLCVGQLEVVDLNVFDNMKEGSQLLVVSNDDSKIESAFDCKLENSQVWLDGVLSRKKQIIPFLQPQF